MTIKVSVICASEPTRAGLAAAAQALPNVEFNAYLGSASVLAGLLQRERPDIVLLDLPSSSEKDIKQVEVALLLAPRLHLVLISPEQSVEFLLRAMRAGVREVLPAPLSLDSVRQAIQHVMEHRAAGVRQQQGGAGRVLAMVPAKGGAGSTFLATNLAFALSRQGKRVAVLDLNMYFGDAVIFLGDSVPKFTLVDLARKSAEMDRTLLESCMVKVSDRLHILVAPESPEHIGEVSTDAIERIIDTARTAYDFVVLDIGSSLDPVSVKALDMSDTICLVLQLNLPFVRATKRMVEAFRELGYANDKVQILVNRHENGGDVALVDVEKATLLKVTRTIPNSHIAVTASINQGIPLLELKPNDPVSLALGEWAKSVAPPDPAAQPATAGGWLSNLKRLVS